MTTADVLRAIALLSAWARADHEAVKILLDEGRPNVIAHLLEFVLMVLGQNTDGNPLAFLEWMGDQARAIQADEARAEQ